MAKGWIHICICSGGEGQGCDGAGTSYYVWNCNDGVWGAEGQCGRVDGQFASRPMF